MWRGTVSRQKDPGGLYNRHTYSLQPAGAIWPPAYLRQQWACRSQTTMKLQVAKLLLMALKTLVASSSGTAKFAHPELLQGETSSLTPPALGYSTWNAYGGDSKLASGNHCTANQNRSSDCQTVQSQPSLP